jgi:hypothetical protein
MALESGVTYGLMLSSITAKSIVRSDQRHTPRCYIQVVETTQSGTYRAFQNTISNDIDPRGNRWSLLGEANLIGVTYEQNRWENGLGGFTIVTAHHSQRWNPPFTAGDMIVCYMWHERLTIGLRVTRQFGNATKAHENMKFVGIVKEINTHISRDGTQAEITGFSLIDQLKTGAISFTVRGRKKFKLQRRYDEEEDRNIYTSVFAGYEAIPIGKVLAKFFKQVKIEFQNFAQYFFSPNQPDTLDPTSNSYQPNSFWTRETSMGIDPFLLEIQISNGIFNAVGSPFDILLKIRNLLRNIGGKRSIEFFVEPTREHANERANPYKGVITIRRAPTLVDLRDQNAIFKNPRSIIGERNQQIKATFGKNIRKGDLIDTIAPMYNSIFIKGKISFTQRAGDTPTQTRALREAVTKLHQVNAGNMDNADGSPNALFAPIDITNEREIKQIIERDNRFKFIERFGRSVGESTYKVRIFGLPISLRRRFGKRIVILRVINQTNAKRFGEISTSFSDPNFNDYDKALSLGIDELAILGRLAHLGWATFLDEQSDRIHMWNSILTLEDRRTNLPIVGGHEWAFQSVAGLNRGSWTLSSPRSKLGIFTYYNLYFFGKISVWWSNQGITTKVKFINARRPGDNVRDSFRELVNKYVMDLVKHKFSRFIPGTIVKKFRDTESDEDAEARERSGIFAVQLDDILYLSPQETESVGLNGTEYARVANFGYMLPKWNHVGMYKRFEEGDKVILYKDGTNFWIVNQIPHEEMAPPAMNRPEELAIVHPYGATLHLGDTLFMNPNQEINARHNSNVQEKAVDRFGNMFVGANRLISMIGKKYESYNRYINNFNPISANDLASILKPLEPDISIPLEQNPFDESERNLTQFGRRDYLPPHPIPNIRGGDTQKLLENCVFFQTQSGGRIFLGELTDESASNGESNMSQRKAFLQQIGASIQLLIGDGWRSFSLNQGKKGSSSSNMKIPGSSGALADLLVDPTTEEFQIGYLPLGATTPIIIKISGSDIILKNDGRKITLSGSNIELENGGTKLTVSATEVNIT